MLQSFRVRNLRAIKDTGIVDLKKLSVVVGKNSSGKSSLLRVLPLLRQSVEQRTKGPILWFGRLVDFGDFEGACRDGDVKRGIQFDFEVRHRTRRHSLLRPPHLRPASDVFVFTPGRTQDIHVSLDMAAEVNGTSSYIRGLFIRIGGDEVQIRFSSEKRVASVHINGEPIDLDENHHWDASDGAVLPKIRVIGEYRTVDEDGDVDVFWDEVDDPFGDHLLDAIRSIAHGRTSHQTLESIAARLKYADEKRFYRFLTTLSVLPTGFSERVVALRASSDQIARLRRAVLMVNLWKLIEIIDDELGAFAKSITYVEPLRAVAERYYRQQDLAVDEVDSRGANTAMFIASLDDFRKKRLSQWMRLNAGFDVAVESSKGHFELKVIGQDGRPRNIADLGFGFSQMIPILLHVWSRSQQFQGGEPMVIAIEQPELHLHPDYQARLADVFASALQRINSSTNLIFFVETHSDHFVNRIGSLVASGKLKSDDIQVLVVEEQGGISSVTHVNFDSQGFLGSSWPLGFFTPSSV